MRDGNQSLDRLSELVEKVEGREIVSRRVIDFPRELVYRAYVEKEHLARWWGPKGFRNTFEKFEPRDGGEWKFVMHGPDGTDYPNYTRFLQLSKLHRAMLQHVSAPKFRMTVTMEGFDGKTRLTMRMLFKTAAECEAIRRYAPKANEENFDRLEAELKSMKGDD
jgi:uncharacterized protein YndB with AHSA1/START domain